LRFTWYLLICILPIDKYLSERYNNVNHYLIDERVFQMNELSMLLQTIEYVAAYFGWGYYFYSVGYFWYDKFNCIVNDMRRVQSNGMIRAVYA